MIEPGAFLIGLGFRRFDVLERVEIGADTLIWKALVAGRLCALRVFRPEQKPAMEKEVRHMDMARGFGTLVPEVVGHGVVCDRPCMVIEWLQGVPLGHALGRKPESMAALMTAFGRAHAELHLRSPELGSAEDWLPKLHHPALREKVRTVEGLSSRLIHLDFHPLNVLTDGDSITGILDWTNSEIGDPRLDVARTLTIFRLSPMADRGDRDARRGLGTMARLYRRGYADVAGKPPSMAPFLAAMAFEMVGELRHHERVNGRALAPEALRRIDRWVRRFHGGRPDDA